MLIISLRVLLSADKRLLLVVRNLILKERRMFGNLTMLWAVGVKRVESSPVQAKGQREGVKHVDQTNRTRCFSQHVINQLNFKQAFVFINQIYARSLRRGTSIS
jgi:hypothetical protein